MKNLEKKKTQINENRYSKRSKMYKNKTNQLAIRIRIIGYNKK